MRDRVEDAIIENFELMDDAWGRELKTLVSHASPDSFESLRPFTAFVFHCDAPTKGMIKAVRRALFELPKADLSVLSLVRTLSQCNVAPIQMIQRISAQQSPLAPNAFCALKEPHVNVLLKHINGKRLIELLWESSLTLLEDALFMMMNVDNKFPSLDYIPKKLSSVNELHHITMQMLPKLSYQNFDLKQRGDILMLDGKSLPGNLTIHVPKTHFDLVQLGASLKFCIGNGRYSTMVAEQRCSIIAVHGPKGPMYGIQFSRYRIMEAQGFGNHADAAPSKGLLRSLSGLLLSMPTSPTDFLPILDSGWVHGYRYDNKDLYLLLKDTVYVYRDVPADIYEELLDSERKGEFVNRYIKRTFNCERIGRLEEIGVLLLDDAC